MIRRSRPDAGVAAVEFAIAVPFVLVLLGGVVDSGRLLRSQNRLAGAVAAAARYASLAGPSVDTTTLSTIVIGSSGLAGITTSISAPACFCPTGTPATLANATCGATCVSGGAAASYVTITGRFTYTPVTPHYGQIVAKTMAETRTVRLK